MAEVEIRPLVVVREHAAGFSSAFAAAVPAWVGYGDDREDALDELRLFLGEYFGRIDGDEVAKWIVPESATIREITVAIPRSNLPRSERPKTPITLTSIVLPAPDDARWVMIPVLAHVAYVPRSKSDDFDETIRREVIRLATARDLDGAEYLDLLPCDSFELERPVVEFEPRGGEKQGRTRIERLKRDKTKAARELLEKIGRRLEKPSREVLHRDLTPLRALLETPARSSVVVVGPAGAGKSAFIRAAVASAGVERPVFATSGAELVAGQSYLGQLERRVEEVMKAAELLDAVLYFEELDDLFAGRPGGYEDIAGLMQRYLERGRVRVIGELTSEHYDRLEHRHAAFFSYLIRIGVAPLDRVQTVAALESRAHLASGAAALVVDLVERYEPYRSLPGKAVTLLEEISALRQAEAQADESVALTPDDVFRGVSAKTGIPEFLLRDERSMLREDVERFFRRGLIGQEQAVRHVAEALCSVKAGLQAVAKPLATFLFVGPTGVGKTELAKALARFLFGSSERMVRFDMSEYADPFAAERLIRGTDREEGVLTRRIREQPFSVLLLDEIEKADPAVFDLLLQVTGEGRLSDARGKLAYFSNAIIIMTSNLGAQQRRVQVGFGEGELDERSFYLAQVRDHFRPEFVNRLDRVVCFYNLSREEIHEVARLSLARIAKRDGFEARDIRLSVSERALEKLGQDGYSAAYGARGLRRHLEQALVAPIAGLLAGIGDAAAGALVRVHVSDETPEAVESELLAESSRGELVFRAFRGARKRARDDLTGVMAVSRMRREIGKWFALGPIAEIRERLAELIAELSLTSGGKRTRRKAPKGAVLGELAAEHARLAALLEPLEVARRELEDIESLVVGALYEGSEPKLLEDEAKAAYRKFRAHLVSALLSTSDEHEITIALHELDDHRVLDKFLMPLLRWIKSRGFDARLHIDRGERTWEDGWPSLEKRRWGPPRTVDQYLAVYADAAESPTGGVPDAERPFMNLLVRVKGRAAGALLSIAIGRWRYHFENAQHGELWVRLVSARYEFAPTAWEERPALRPEIEVEVGKRQGLCFEFADDVERLTRVPGQPVFEDLEEHQVFERWEELIFERVVAVVEAGGSYLPAEE